MTTAMARARLDALAKPSGSLGQLERLAERLAITQGTLSPVTKPRRLLIFAGDHGVVAAGVGIWPSEVTAAMIALIASGRAASSALARSSDTDLQLIDVGSCAPPHPASAIVIDQRIGRGARNLATEPALSVADFDRAFAVGVDAVERAAHEGYRVIAIGELGIGNTTPAACLIALLTGTDTATCVGPGAGATEATLARKREVVATAVARARQLKGKDPRAAIADVAGYEIAAMAGAITAASRLKVTVVLDGVVTAAAALIARALDPRALDTAIAAHTGAEPAHRIALGSLGLEGALEWQLRLGEGTGALLLMPMLDAACALLTDVATLADVMGGST